MLRWPFNQAIIFALFLYMSFQALTGTVLYVYMLYITEQMDRAKLERSAATMAT